MFTVQLLRESVHERISAAAGDFLLQLEKGEEAAELPVLRALLTERLTAAADEIVALLEETVAEYEDRVQRSEREIYRQRRLLDAVLKPEVRLHRADVHQLLLRTEEVPEQQQWSSGVDQEDPEPPHIKEEQEELWSIQEGEQLQGLEEAEVTRFSFTPVPVKREDDEEKPHQSPSEENTETQPPTEDDGDHCGGSEAASNGDDPLSPTHHRTSTFDQPDHRGDQWIQTNHLQSGVPQSDNRSDTGGKSCSVCRRTCRFRGELMKHMRTHTGEKPFTCSICGRRFSDKSSMTKHMRIHTGERPYSCSVCDRRFMWCHQITYHRCVRDTSQLHQSPAEGNATHNGDPLSHTDQGTSPSGEPVEKVDKPLGETSRRSNQNKFICSVCNKSLSHRHTLVVHMRLHTGEKPFSCSRCHMTFSHHTAMVRHKSTHKETTISCGVCEQRFTEQRELEEHRCDGETSQLHQSPPEEKTETPPPTGADGDGGGGPEEDPPPPTDHGTPHSDPETEDSGDWTETRDTLKNISDSAGETRRHSKRTKFTCSVCKKRYKYHHTLVMHMRRHTGEPFSCSLCHMTFATCKLLSLHRTGRRCSNAKLFTCSVCGKEFTKKCQLRRHIRGHKAHSCSFCDRRFTNLTKLKKHQCVGKMSQLHQSPAEGRRPFPCDVCGKGVSTLSALDEHMRCHTGGKPFSCYFCRKDFKRRQLLRNHLCACADDGLFTCSACGRKFTEHHQLRGHECQSRAGCDRHVNGSLLQRPDDRPFVCSVCDASFKVKNSLLKHLKQHSGEETSCCSICGQMCASKKDQMFHMLSHVNTGCSVCGQTFTLRKQLREHECSGAQTQLQSGSQSGPRPPKKNGVTDRQFRCVDCRKTFQTETSLQTHLRSHTCSICHTFVRNPSALKKHRKLHFRHKPFHCPFCDQSFFQHFCFERHMEGHSAARPFECSVCSRRFKYESKLQRHLTTHREKSYSCSVCGKTLKNRHSLTRHLSAHQEENLTAQLHHSPPEKNTETPPPTSSSSGLHTEVRRDDLRNVDEEINRRFSCSECSRRFRHKSELQVHTTTHTGEKPYSCPFCGRSFGQSSNMYKHMRLHLGETPFSCSFCGRRFSRKKSLTSHMFVHEEENLISCSVCEQRFTEQRQLEEHRCDGETSQLHQEDPEPPHVKEEQEELWSSQEGEQLQGLEEADVTRFSFTPVPVKREDDEEKPHQSPSEENTETQPPTSSSNTFCGFQVEVRLIDCLKTREFQDLKTLEKNGVTQCETGRDDKHQHIEPEDAGDHCGGSEAASNRDDPLSPTNHGTSTSDQPDLRGGLMSVEKNQILERDTGCGDKPFRCSECGGRFRHKNSLQQHIRAHSGEKPFSCSLCGNRFTRRSSLTQHMMIHSGEKRFTCSICGKHLAHRSALTRHMRVHSGEKPFSCSLCGKRFTRRNSLRRHVSAHEEKLTNSSFYAVGETSQLHQSPLEENRHNVQPVALTH